MASRLRRVGTSSKTGRRLPLPMAEAVARAVERFIAERFRGARVSEREIAEALGLSQPALNKIRHADGSLGINTLLALRTAIGVSLDDLLELPPLEASRPALTEAELDAVRKLLTDFRDQVVAEQPKPAPVKAKKRRS